MNRKDFERLTFEEQLKYVNTRSTMTTKEISEEIGMPSSTLTNIFSRAGYKRLNGKYVTIDPNSSITANPLEELLQYKDQIISLVLDRHQPQNQSLDFSPLKQYPKQEGKETITFELPKKMAKQLSDVVERFGYKKQSLLCLLIYQFIERNGR